MKALFIISLMFLLNQGLQSRIIHIPQDYSSIQGGIDASVPWDTVLISEGLYYEKINLGGHAPLLVGSLFIIDGNLSHRDNTIIDGSYINQSSAMSVVTFGPGNDTTTILCGLTIQKGRGTLSELPDLNGGGIWITGCGARISYNVIQSNTVNDTLFPNSAGCTGGGISMAYSPNFPVIIEYNIVRNNKVRSIHPGNYAYGGGIYIYSNARLINNIVQNNSISSLDSTAYGAGIFVDGNSNMYVNILNNIISGNVANAVRCRGGGVYALYCRITCKGNTICGNILIDPTGTGVANEGDGAGFYGKFLAPQTSFISNTFEGNRASPYSGWGGGLYLYRNLIAPDEKLIENNYFIGNHALNGGAIGISEPSKMINNVFSSNVAGNAGGAIIFSSYCHQLINNSFSNQIAQNNAAALYSNDTVDINVINSVFWHDTVIDIHGVKEISGHGKIELAYCDIDTNGVLMQKNVFGPAIFYTDPLFMDTTHLHPQVWSQCVDNGTSQYTTSENLVLHAPADDIVGTPRPAGAGYDIGAWDDISGGVGVSEKAGISVKNFPDPFGFETTFEYYLEKSESVSITIFNNKGVQVDLIEYENQSSGLHKILWKKGNLPPGIYFYIFRKGGYQEPNKMIIM